MEPLINYISSPIKWDGHIHLFNHKSSIARPNGCSKYVCFMDIEYDDLDNINVLESYKRFIDNDYNKYTDLLLATGVTIDDIKELYSKYSKIIRGFGELKCYDNYKGNKVPYKKIKLVRDVLKFSSQNGNLPVYVHWDLNDTNDLTKLSNAIKDYSSVPFVLCHFGLTDNNSEFAIMAAAQLQREYGNVWLDMSYTAIDYFSNNLLKLSNFDYNRIIFGTDYNNKLFTNNHAENERESIIEKISDVINYTQIINQNNIKDLFKYC